MARATTSAPSPAAGRMPPSWLATAVPASTGATEAASGAGRTAAHQRRPGAGARGLPTPSSPLGKRWKVEMLRRARGGAVVGAVTGGEEPLVGAGLAEEGVVRGDRQVAHDVEPVASADRVARHHRDHGLGQPPDLDPQVEDVEPSCARGI